MKPVAIFLSLILLAVLPAFGSVKSNLVTGASVEEDDSELRVLFSLSEPDLLAAKDLELKSDGSLFWVELPNSTDKQKKRIFYSWKNERIQGLGLRKLNGQKVAVRVLFKGKMQPENGSWAKADVVGDHLVVSFPKQAPVSPVVKQEPPLAEVEQETAPAPPPIDLSAIFDTAPTLESPAGKNEEPAAAAAEHADVPPAATSDPGSANRIPSLASAAVKFGSALIIVLGTIFLSAWVAKRYNLRDRLSGSAPGVVRVVGTAMLGLKKQVAVIDVAGQFWVVGLGPAEITLLGKVDDPNAIASLSGRREQSPAPRVVFATPAAGPVIEDFPAEEPEPMAKAEPEPSPAAEEEPTQSPFNRLLDLRQRETREESAPAEELETIRSIKQRLQSLKRL